MTVPLPPETVFVPLPALNSRLPEPPLMETEPEPALTQDQILSEVASGALSPGEAQELIKQL